MFFILFWSQTKTNTFAVVFGCYYNFNFILLDNHISPDNRKYSFRLEKINKKRRGVGICFETPILRRKLNYFVSFFIRQEIECQVASRQADI